MKFNAILGNRQRKELEPVISRMLKAIPIPMARKIPEANVQQAFVVEAVEALWKGNSDALCVGAYEDTAYLFLLEFYVPSLGGTLLGIDPMLGDQDFGGWLASHPERIGTFDCVFATSVLEHVDEPEVFIREMCAVLRPGGTGILTCDYDNAWKSGDPKPESDKWMFDNTSLRRFQMIVERNNCELVDPPEWGDNPREFCLAGRYRYDFATMVFRKVS